MKNIGRFATSCLVLAAFAMCVISVPAQRARTRAAAKPRQIVFAVLNDGKTLEPLAFINKGKLEPTVSGGDAEPAIAAFNRTYYKPETQYRLIFGAAESGTVTVKTSNAKSECSRNIAVATTRTAKTPLQGLVMGLATNASVKAGRTAYRRKPTAAEKTEVEALVRAEFNRQKLTPKVLRYHNFTALDLDADGQAELVGSYWTEIDKMTRGLLFFIAAQDKNGKYRFGYKEYRSIDEGNVMSGEIKSVDDGVYHELLLDAFDYNGDGVAEIFTYQQSFEGAGFAAYRRTAGTRNWVKAFDGSNYHCGY